MATICLEKGIEIVESRTTMGSAETAQASRIKGASEERSNMTRLGFSERAQVRGLSSNAKSA
jgi:hypothetical protein